MIWRVDIAGAPWATVVVRAATEVEALELGRGVAETYTDSRDGVSVEQIDEHGPAGVLIEDWS